jgi:ATP-binding cassette subfamily B protein
MSVEFASPLEYRYRGKSATGKLWSFFTGDKGKVAGSVVCFVIKRLPVWTWPIFWGWTINIVGYPEKHPIWQLWAVVGAMVVMHLINPPFHMIYTALSSRAMRNMEARLRSALVRRLQQLSIAFHDDAQSGKLQAKILRDVEVIQRLCETIMYSLLSSVVALIVAMGTAIVKYPIMALFFVGLTPVAVGVHVLFRRRIQRRNRDFRKTIEQMSGTVSEVIDMVPVARAHAVEQEEINRVDDQLEDVRRKGYELDMVTALFNISGWSAFMGARLACVAVSGWMAWTGKIEAGDVVMYLGLFQMVLSAVESLLYAYPAIAMGAESLDSVGEILECPDLERNEGKRRVGSVEGAFEFRDVGFAYPGSDTPAVAGLNLTVQPNESVAVIGQSGAGKSTLMSLVIGFYRPTSGQILLDGADMEDLDLRSYRHHLAVVPQNTTLFSGSIRENIAYGMTDVGDEEIWEALRVANADEFVGEMPEKLDTSIGENGVKLSGGQRQRIAIARAVVRRPKVIIFDEATSSLDVFAEAQVQEAVERMLAGRTTFVVAHRLSTIRKCTRIVVMREGRVVETGSHEDLFDSHGEFFRLKTLQV